MIFFMSNCNKEYNKKQYIWRPYIPVKSIYVCMYKLNLVTIISIVAAVSLVVGMTAPAAFAQDNMTMNNMSSMGNMTEGNATAGNMTETESLPSAGETGYHTDPFGGP